MNDDTIKEAFSRVKQDIYFLGEEILNVKTEIIELKSELKLINGFIEDIKQMQFLSPTNKPTNQHTDRQQFQHINSQNQEYSPIPTHTPTYPSLESNTFPIPTHTPTHPQEIGGLLSPNLAVSTGNRGVPTDKPTDRQTNQQTFQHISIVDKIVPSSLDRASEILSSLDNLKKEVRLKFKRLTSQELQVFSLLYSLEDQQITVDYKLLADRLKLSESSIRDYIGKIQKKGIPINKEKLNNKRVILHISSELRQIASLNTILQLREL